MGSSLQQFKKHHAVKHLSQPPHFIQPVDLKQPKLHTVAAYPGTHINILSFSHKRPVLCGIGKLHAET